MQCPHSKKYWQVCRQLPVKQCLFQSSVGANSEKFQDMHDLLSEIERTVKARGWSARQALMHAVGTRELIHEGLEVPASRQRAV